MHLQVSKNHQGDHCLSVLVRTLNLVQEAAGLAYDAHVNCGSRQLHLLIVEIALFKKKKKFCLLELLILLAKCLEKALLSVILVSWKQLYLLILNILYQSVVYLRQLVDRSPSLDILCYNKLPFFSVLAN